MCAGGAYTCRASHTLGFCPQGLAYLLTFLFAANTVGLTGLALQLVLFPDADLDRPPSAPKPGADLPKVRAPRRVQGFGVLCRGL